MKKFIVAAFAVLAIFAVNAAHADGLTIAAGKKGRGYDSAARVLETRLAQRQIHAEVINTDGSDAATLSVCAGAADIAITQIDAMDEREAGGCQLKPFGFYGAEYAMILFPPKSKLDSLDQLTEEHSVLVDTVGSGSELFARSIKRIETGDHGNKSKWHKFNAVAETLDLAGTMYQSGEIHALIMVRTLKSKDLSFLISRGWTLGELYDKDLNDYAFRDAPMYVGAKIKTRIAGKKVRGYGYEVRSFFVASPELAADRKTFGMLAGLVR